MNHPEVVVEADGMTILLALPEIPGNAILKIDAPDLVSEAGEPLVFPSFFYTVKE